MAQATVRHIVCSEKTRVAVYEWGSSGPTAVLVHGWGARASRLCHLAPLLQQRGWRVVAFDAPAHGLSEGRATWLPVWIDVLQQVVRDYGPVQAVVAHSFGALATCHALKAHTDVRVALISMPSRFRELVPYFGRQLELAPAVLERLERLTVRRFARFGHGMDAVDRHFSPRFFGHATTFAPLIVHDRDDKQVDVAQSEELAAAWPQAELLLTYGLGHQRLLHDAAVVDRLLNFVCRTSDAGLNND